MVRGHERKTKHGTAYVRFHFKGAREFDWAGYRVTVTVPGRDHIMLPEISIGTVDEYWTTKDQEYLSSEQYGATIKEVINTPRVP
jgi:hypothetical protein